MARWVAAVVVGGGCCSNGECAVAEFRVVELMGLVLRKGFWV